jgi:hypothetical protein
MGKTRCGRAATFDLVETTSFMDQHDCPFCRLETNRIRLESEFAVAFFECSPRLRATPLTHSAVLARFL